MSGVVYMLREEKKRLAELIAVYKEKIASLPQGRIVLRGRGRAYAYQVFVARGKEKQVYLGPATSPEVVRMQEGIRRRKAYEERIEDAIEEAALIGRMLRVR